MTSISDVTAPHTFHLHHHFLHTPGEFYLRILVNFVLLSSFSPTCKLFKGSFLSCLTSRSQDMALVSGWLKKERPV